MPKKEEKRSDICDLLYICNMTKEDIQDLRDRVASLRRHL
jgi:hypothetical protein